MSVEVVNRSSEETFMVKVTIINPRPMSVLLPAKYHCLFRGVASLSYGRHIVSFPVTHIGYKRLVSSLQSEFRKTLRVDFGMHSDTDIV